MFDKEFYPTPKPVIRQMLKGFTATELEKRSILEPSAGRGDILDYIKGRSGHDEYSVYRGTEFDLYCIEQNPELAEILKGKGYRYIHNDFLNYSGDHHFDLIIMNPPFSNGHEHLLKAWDVLSSGDIVCLLNEQTIKNPNSKEKQLLARLIEQHGSVEYLGNVFSQADRKTDVNVAMVKMQKQDAGGRFDFFKGTSREKQYTVDENIMNNPVARQDVIGNLVLSYDNAKKAYIEYLKAYDTLQFYTGPLLRDSDRFWDHLKIAGKENTNEKRYNSFCNMVRDSAWRMIMNKTKVSDVATAKVRDDFDKFSAAQGHMDFTTENIFSLLDTLFQNRGEIMYRCLMDVFDKLCSYDEKNKLHWEGWKTNDAHKVNRKVIMPYFISFSYGSFSTNYHREYSALDDIDKVLCMLSGNKVDEVITIRRALDDAWHRDRSNPGTAMSTFFELRYFKKGTLHMIFRDEKIWELFNISAAKGKNWLPEQTKKQRGKKTNKPSGPIQATMF